MNSVKTYKTIPANNARVQVVYVDAIKKYLVIKSDKTQIQMTEKALLAEYEPVGVIETVLRVYKPIADAEEVITVIFQSPEGNCRIIHQDDTQEIVDTAFIAKHYVEVVKLTRAKRTPKSTTQTASLFDANDAPVPHSV